MRDACLVTSRGEDVAARKQPDSDVSSVPAEAPATRSEVLTAIGAIHAYAASGKWQDLIQLYAILDEMTDGDAPSVSRELGLHLARAGELAHADRSAAPLCFVLIDCDDRVVALNEDGVNLLAPFAAPVECDKRLSFRDRDLQSAFAAASAEVLQGDAGPTLLRLRDDAHPQQIGLAFLVPEHALPPSLALLGADVDAARRPLRALVAPSQTVLFTDGDILQSVLGLTAAESRLAQLLQSGMAVKDAAAEIGIAVPTARNQLRAIFDKLGVTRQSDMVRHLLSLGALASALPTPKAMPRADDAPRKLDVGGGRMLAFREYGALDGIPVMMFTTWSSSSLQPSWVDEAARRHGIRLIPVERPGTGQSSPDVALTHESFARLSLRLADALGISGFRVMGHASGAVFALALAAQAPHRIEAVMLRSARLAASGRARDPNAVARSFFGAIRRMPRLVEATGPLLRSRLSRKVLRSMVLGFFADSPVDHAILTQDSALLHHIVASTSEALSHGFGGLFRETALLMEGCPAAADSIQAPLTVWHGAQDGVIPVEAARSWLEGLPVRNFRVMADEGHLLQSRLWDDAFIELRAMA